MTTVDNPARLLDLTNIPLDKLLRLEGDTALDAALLRAIQEAEEQPEKAVSAFNSAM